VPVVVYERERWPRVKVCGDGLNPASVAELASLGLGRPSGPRLTGTLVSGPAERAFIGGWPATSPDGTTEPRVRSDARLLAAAVAAGARFESGVAVRAVASGALELEAGGRRTTAPRTATIVLADGARAGRARARLSRASPAARRLPRLRGPARAARAGLSGALRAGVPPGLRVALPLGDRPRERRGGARRPGRRSRSAACLARAQRHRPGRARPGCPARERPRRRHSRRPGDPQPRRCPPARRRGGRGRSALGRGRLAGDGDGSALRDRVARRGRRATRNRGGVRALARGLRCEQSRGAAHAPTLRVARGPARGARGATATARRSRRCDGYFAKTDAAWFWGTFGAALRARRPARHGEGAPR